MHMRECECVSSRKRCLRMLYRPTPFLPPFLLLIFKPSPAHHSQPLPCPLFYCCPAYPHLTITLLPRSASFYLSPPSQFPPPTHTLLLSSFPSSSSSASLFFLCFFPSESVFNLLFSSASLHSAVSRSSLLLTSAYLLIGHHRPPSLHVPPLPPPSPPSSHVLRPFPNIHASLLQSIYPRWPPHRDADPPFLCL